MEEMVYSDNSLENINNLKVRAQAVESRAMKGLLNERDVEREIEELRLSCLETASDYYDYSGDEFSGQMAEKFRKPMSFNPKEVALVLKDIVCDIAELYARAFKLMLENMSHSHIVKVETAYENDMFERQWKSEQKMFERQEKHLRRRRKVKEKDSSYVDHTKDRVKPRRARHKSFESSSDNIRTFTRPRRTRSNIVYVRNRELRPARSFGGFRRSRSGPSSDGPQMSL